MVLQYPLNSLNNKITNFDYKLDIDVSKFSIEQLFSFLLATVLVSPEIAERHLRKLPRETLEQLLEFIKRHKTAYEKESAYLINIIQVSITSIYVNQENKFN